METKLATEENSTDLARTEMNPSVLLQMAVQKDLDIAKLEKLMELQERWQANQARISFFEAMAKFQSIVPPLEKKKQVAFNDVKYKYAPLGEITETIKEPMFTCGLSYRWEIADKDTALECSCIVSHREGHSERTTMSAAKDASGKKNEIQSRGSTITYLERYTLIAALGISTADEDNDGQGQGIPAKNNQEKKVEISKPAPVKVEQKKNGSGPPKPIHEKDEEGNLTKEWAHTVKSVSAGKVPIETVKEHYSLTPEQEVKLKEYLPKPTISNE